MNIEGGIIREVSSILACTPIGPQIVCWKHRLRSKYPIFCAIKVNETEGAEGMPQREPYRDLREKDVRQLTSPHRHFFKQFHGTLAWGTSEYLADVGVCN